MNLSLIQRVKIKRREVGRVVLGIGYPLAVGRPDVIVNLGDLGPVHQHRLLLLDVHIREAKLLVRIEQLLAVGRPGRRKTIALAVEGYPFLLTRAILGPYVQLILSGSVREIGYPLPVR